MRDKDPVARQTDRLAARAEKLAELDRASTKLFTKIAHEFHTPLTLILRPLRDLQAGKCGSLAPEAVRQIDLARRNAERMLDLINQLLDIDRLDAGCLSLRVRCSDLVAFLGGLVERFMPLAERREIDLRLVAPPEQIRVYFDHQQLEKVFANVLLSTALKFAPAGGSVRVQIEAPVADANRVAVRVWDSGPGIPPHELQKIFDRSSQVADPVTRRYASAGLALARDLMELHGGTLAAESEVGSGSTFTVELRLGSDHFTDDQLAPDGPTPFEGVVRLRPAASTAADEGATARVERLGADGDGSGEDRTTVLVSDDHPGLRDDIRHHIASRDRVVESADGSDGIGRAGELPPDLIVSDATMPGMDDCARVPALRQDPELDGVPVDLLTAKASLESKLDGTADGADDDVTKPFDVGELFARFDGLIASHRRLRERIRAEAANGEGSALPETSAPDVASDDQAFLERVTAAIDAGLTDEDFDVKTLADRVATSRSNLYRRLDALISRSPAKLIVERRLERAAHLLVSWAGSVSEVAYAVGFKSVSHFSQRFRSRYGISPSAYHNLADGGRTAGEALARPTQPGTAIPPRARRALGPGVAPRGNG